jgi:hypothetical protein
MISRAKLRLPGITESEFLDQVLQYAKLRGWRSAHFRPAKTIDGWRTPVSGDGKGFPDLLLVRGDRVIVAELKVGKNKLTLEQITHYVVTCGNGCVTIRVEGLSAENALSLITAAGFQFVEMPSIGNNPFADWLCPECAQKHKRATRRKA